MYGFFLLMHVLSATVWTGGHLVLGITLLPKALRERSVADLTRFEKAYERIGIPALLIQLVTGVWLAYRLVPDVRQWFVFETPVASLVGVKLILLFITLVLAGDARLRVIPKLSEEHLPNLAWHIIPVTVVSVLFVLVGVSFRTGWFF